MRRRAAEHPIEEVGEKLRAMMPWIAQERAGRQDAQLSAARIEIGRRRVPSGAAAFFLSRCAGPGALSNNP